MRHGRRQRRRGRALDRRDDGGPARQAADAFASGRVRRSIAARSATTAIAARRARSGLRAVTRAPPSRTTVPPVSAMATATTTSASASQSRAVAARDRCTSSVPCEESRPESAGFYRDRRPSARSSTRMRASEQRAKTEHGGGAGDRRLREQRKSHQLPDDADVVRMAEETVGSVERAMRSGRHEHTKRPALAERRNRPVLESLGRQENRRADDRDRRETHFPATTLRRASTRKHPGYATCIQR